MSRDTQETQVELVRALFAATGSGDWSRAESLLTDDFFVTEAPTNPFAGVYRGKRALQELYARVIAASGVTGLEIKQLTVGGDVVVALVEMSFSGIPERVSLAEVFRFRDGKVCEIKPHYFDSQPLAAAVAQRRS